MNRNQQSNGGGRPGTIFSAGAPSEPEQPAHHNEHKPKNDTPDSAKPTNPLMTTPWFRWAAGAAVVIVAILIAAVLALTISFKPAGEDKLVDTSKLQAVFLTNDQVYFGKISVINSKFIVLNKIYYLQTSGSNSTSKSSTSGNNISLVKLGCELHKPQDQMVISQEQVSFWENLQSDGQVANAVASYEKANPSGQKCDTTNQSANPVQGSSDTTNNTSPTNNNTTTNNSTDTSNKKSQ